ncbi:cystathionine beta-lyase [Oharaeibacter diazotrophicus]|uniref:Cystathionine beta-lyase n=1 Tax=Oharaeibacter diazotrophicus TaxID=1920512 RepID=A0A4V3CWN9_9HYPH|nr:cystathionine beta-lyase [Oharaeibacter diazotrophicus]TDP87058.1 cystathionine beta-lyase [Oharaeibacter diazotrophicus]BBE70999.1 cystathionine beta-lyase MetC [Pleomorphomonas sp. SM30]GLS77749.1 cystathionine beta-lyase [Oharaeibacter diazotrophicus]
MSKDDKATADVHTRLAHGGRDPRAQHGFVNPPVYHGSTVTFPDVETMLSGRQRYHYGRRGTPTTDALTGLLAELDGAAGVVLCPSGLSAISTALLSLASAGDHVLITDSAYGPTRHFADGVMKRMGISVDYYDPTIGAGIAALMRPNTRVVMTEAPGSQTFEMQDVPAVAAAARDHGAFTVMDNTWATPVYFRPLDHGVDVALMAATKYVVGHSDVMMGTVAANDRAWPLLKAFHGDSGLCCGPDDVNLALRGLRTMAVRLARHQESALAVAGWLETRPEVAKVLHPALPSHPGHALWRRDFSGASGLFSFVTREMPLKAVAAMLDGLAYFGLGYSWGGFESLAIVADPRKIRTATTWNEPGHLVRLHVGLEDPDDLIADLASGFDRMNAVREG